MNLASPTVSAMDRGEWGSAAAAATAAAQPHECEANARNT